MSPFTSAQTPLKPSLWDRLSSKRGPLIFVISLALGLGAVAWLAGGRAESARTAVRAEAQARAASLEVQFNQAIAAAEVLGALARQGRGGIPDFQRVATELLASHPGLTLLELQPGGVVSEVVPRVGHERMVGVNVLKDPNQLAGANAALARRVLTVDAPVRLDHGEQGLVVRVPIFLRAADGREGFWGFVTASLRLQEALSRARVNELSRRGYCFAFFLLPSGQQRGVTIASYGLASLADAVQEPVRAQNLEFRVAVKPRSGWISTAKVVIEALAVLLVSGLVGLSAKLLESSRLLEVEMTTANQRVAREVADRNQAQEEARGMKDKLATAQAELKQSRTAVQQVEARAAQMQTELDAAARTRDEGVSKGQAELQEALRALQGAQEATAQLQGRLDAAVRAKDEAAHQAEAELKKGRTELKQARETAAQLQTRLEASVRERDQAVQEGEAELKKALAALQKARESITHLQGRLEAGDHARDEAAQAGAAELKKEQAALRKARETIGQLQARLDAAAEARETSEKQSSAPLAPAAAVPPEGNKEVVKTVSNDSSEAAVAEPASAEDAPSPAGKEPESLTELPASEAATAAATPIELLAAPEPARPVKRKKARRDDQMQLFGEQAPANPVAGEADVRAPEPKEAKGSAEEPAPAPKENKPSPSRPLPAAPPLDPAQLRKAVNQIVPLLAEQDPGAQECLKDNRTTFRSGFTPEAYVEFEQLVKGRDFSAALEQLKRAVRKHGINVA